MKNYCNENQKMPLYGIGPFLILTVALLSLLGILLSITVLSGGTVNGPGKLLFYFAAFVLIILGFLIWCPCMTEAGCIPIRLMSLREYK